MLPSKLDTPPPVPNHLTLSASTAIGRTLLSASPFSVVYVFHVLPSKPAIHDPLAYLSFYVPTPSTLSASIAIVYI